MNHVIDRGSPPFI